MMLCEQPSAFHLIHARGTTSSQPPAAPSGAPARLAPKMPRGRAPPKPPPPASRGSDGDSESSGGELDGTSDALAWIAKVRAAPPARADAARAVGGMRAPASTGHHASVSAAASPSPSPRQTGRRTLVFDFSATLSPLLRSSRARDATQPRPMSARERRALGPELAARAAAAKAAASAQETAAARAGCVAACSARDCLACALAWRLAPQAIEPPSQGHECHLVCV